MKIATLFFILSLISIYGISQKTKILSETNDTLTDKNFSDKKVEHTVFLIGNTGSQIEYNPHYELFAKEVLAKGKTSSLIFLGNQIYPNGFDDTEDENEQQSAYKLEKQLSYFKKYDGNIHIIPGRRDWDKGRDDGEDFIDNQSDFIADYFDNDSVFVPFDNCPGPVEIPLDNDIILIVIDSQWWLQATTRFGHDNDCDYRREEQFLIQIIYSLRRHKDKKIIFASHYPLFSAGRHGGHFPFKQKIFPLTAVKKRLFVPLPGFLYTGYRRFLGAGRDLSHPEYKDYRSFMFEILKEAENVVFVSGHEENLQYKHNADDHFIISGAAGTTGYVTECKDADFASSKQGFAKLIYLKNGEVWLEFQSPDKKFSELKTIYRKFLYKIQTTKEKKEKTETIINYTDSTIITNTSDRYVAGKAKSKWLGDNYRNVWASKTEFPVFDIGKIEGGLKVTKRGGGMTSRSFRLEDKNGREFVLRSVDKYADKLLPDVIQNTFAVDIVQDQISAAHPYAALVVAKLADAAGIYHTNPKLFYVPDDPRLGEYRKDMANQVFLFEERPAGNRKDVESFGRSDDIVSFRKAVKKTHKKQKHRIDEEWVLKSRIFDLFINDWDRHDDQWRWAKFDDGKKTIYRPIPRDRDQAMSVVDGIIPTIASKPFAMKKLQGFDYDSEYVEGLIFNARFFDRAFLSSLSRDKWIETANKLKNELTDEVIEQAVKALPEKIYDISGKEMTAILKSRRDKLNKFAREAYKVLAKKVDIVGTNGREFFDIHRINDSLTKVEVYKYKKEKKKGKLYQRTFNINETKEIRCFGLKGKDKFYVYGKVNKGIKVRIVGGKKKDEIVDESHVKGLTKKTIVYDKKKKTELTAGKETKDKTSRNKKLNKYNRRAFKYPLVYPGAYVIHNDLDGTIVRLGFNIKTPAFQKDPWGMEQKIVAKFMTKMEGFRIRYNNLIHDVAYHKDFFFEAYFDLPRPQNYFGYGNGSKLVDPEDENYNRIYMFDHYLNPQIIIRPEKNHFIHLGTFYNKIFIDDDDGPYIHENIDIIGRDIVYEKREYAGLNVKYILDSRDDYKLPARGIFWTTEADYFYSLNPDFDNYTKLSSDFHLYLSRSRNSLFVLALRLSGAVNFGDYAFYQAPSLGFKQNLRGFRQTRFYGDKSLFQNSELRIKLFPFHTYIFNGSFGINAFYDIGRVWSDKDISDKWHKGYGGGIWLSPFDMAVLNVTYGMSDEDKITSIKLKYFF